MVLTTFMLPAGYHKDSWRIEEAVPELGDGCVVHIHGICRTIDAGGCGDLVSNTPTPICGSSKVIRGSRSAASPPESTARAVVIRFRVVEAS